MFVVTGDRRRSIRSSVAGGVLVLLGAAGCQSERAASHATAQAGVVTQIEMVRPATDRGASPPPVSAPGAQDRLEESAAYCVQVERQARETNESLPKRLDRDTSATRVAAYGCDVVLEYAMLDLAVSDVAVEGVRAMRGEVLEKLCSDRGARGVLEHGGSFTNVYRDDKSALIDQFTIAAEDCWDRRSADSAPVRVDL